MQETQIQSLGEEEPLEKEMASHSGILAWEILQAEEPGGLYTPWGHRELDVTLRISREQQCEKCRIGKSI